MKEAGMMAAGAAGDVGTSGLSALDRADKDADADMAAGHEIDLDRYAPFLINAASTAWTRQIAGTFREKFGLGVVEWRVIAVVNAAPGSPATRICTALRMDKAAISRSLHFLAERGDLEYRAEGGDPRRRRWWLSEQGRALFAQLLDIALDAETRMLRDVSEAELESFLSVTRKFLANLEE